MNHKKSQNKNIIMIFNMFNMFIKTEDFLLLGNLIFAAIFYCLFLFYGTTIIIGAIFNIIQFVFLILQIFYIKRKTKKRNENASNM